ncbi:lantibiotic dehydratase [Micromonospora sp. WMMA1363]|uniref:lantibiotic dehydratase n=1 Tax=Micromonospora sp. WMMA1363 TaxID=3053985 RepID=UPI00259CFC31|nr:lantibiotic dehydratase [Micromonospora sp. WMMA1363]MDM4719451.1 lantibiotic dehydratase [Micromonospora sp. WMMA1363]
MTEQPTRWQLYPRLLLRRAGFGIDLLTVLADGPTLAAAERYRGAERQFARCRSRLLEDIAKTVTRADRQSDRAKLRELSRARSRAGRGLSVDRGSMNPEVGPAVLDYGTAHTAREQAARRLTDVLAQEASHRPDRIHALLADDRVCDALLQLSPSFHGEVVRWTDGWAHRGGSQQRGRAKDRAFYRRVYLYGQRLAAKNETTSFFGPLVHGRVDRTAEGIGLGPETATGVHLLEAQTAFWAVCELARHLGTDPAVRDRLPVTWVPSCRRQDGGAAGSGTIHTAADRRITLSGARWALARGVDDRRSVRDLAVAAGVGVVEARHLLDRLRQAGAVRLWPEPPSTTARPLDWLVSWADRHADGTDWPARLRRLAGLADRYAAAEGHRARATALTEVEAGFTALTARDARRAGGQMYADRLVVSLDAKGDQSPVVVGGDVARRWEEHLTPILDVAARYGELHQRVAADLCAGILRAAGADALPYDELIRRVRPAVEAGALTDLSHPVDEFTRAYTALVRSGLHGQEARLTPADLVALAPDPGRDRFVSPDLMLERQPAGPELLVLGELHPYVFAWGSQGLFCDDQDRMLADFAAGLEPWGGRGQLATVIRRRRHKGLVADWFPGRFIEITSFATEDRDRTVPLTDLTAVLVDGVPRLRTPDGELSLYAGEDDHVHLRAFAAPGVALPLVRFGNLAPRIRVGDVIVQRARWWFGSADLGVDAVRDATGAFLAVQSLRARHGLPRFCFASAAHEPKPVGVDLDNPLAVDTLVAMTLAGEDRTVSLAEMRPAPDALWLRHGGRPVTSEFRIAMKRASS